MIFRLKKNVPSGKGFTLIEIMVVIAIISFISSMILFATKSARDAADNAYSIHTIDSYEQGFYLYAQAHNGTLPWCPTSGPCSNIYCLAASDCSPPIKSNQKIISALAPYVKLQQPLHNAYLWNRDPGITTCISFPTNPKCTTGMDTSKVSIFYFLSGENQQCFVGIGTIDTYDPSMDPTVCGITLDPKKWAIR
ncbi:MAG: type II secretion system protein [Minisyncoccota bacterium]